MGLIFCSFTFCVGVCISQELAAPWVWAQHGPLWGGRAGHCPSHKPSREQDSGGQLGHPQLWALGTSVVWAEAKLRHQPMGEGQLDCSGVLRLGRVGRTHPINALMSLAVDTDWKRKKKALWSWSGSLCPLYTYGNNNFQHKGYKDLLNSIWIPTPLSLLWHSLSCRANSCPSRFALFQPFDENHLCGRMFGFAESQSKFCF